MTEKKMTIKQVKQALSQIDSDEDPLFLELKKDSRKGIKNILNQRTSHKEKALQLIEHRRKMLLHENRLKEMGFDLIAGIDEVGRGPLAGPVVAAAVILPTDMPALQINDSKRLSLKVRNELYDIIMEKADVGIGIVDNTVIDEINIYQATRKAMKEAVLSLHRTPDALLIDAMQIATDIKQVSLIKGDAQSYSIAAASIVAKVYRDRLMEKYAEEFPHYQFENNAGYGTKAHLKSLEEYGVTSIHRKSFEPIKSKIKY